MSRDSAERYTERLWAEQQTVCHVAPEIEGFLARSKTVVVPIGSNEQHGPVGLIGTDHLCAEAIARVEVDEVPVGKT